VASFLEDENTKRLLVYVDGKDLSAVSAGKLLELFGATAAVCALRRTAWQCRQTSTWSTVAAMASRKLSQSHLCVIMQSVKPPQKLKRKAVYFVKTAPARLDNDNIRSLVSAMQ
jgi:hypothetical protein